MKRFLFAALLPSLGSCMDASSPVWQEQSISAPQFTDDCQVFDCGSDPNPELDGVYLGSGVTDTWCDEAASDGDHDGIHDRCEEILAEAFRPEMISAGADDVRGEAYWAVQGGVDPCGVGTCLGGRFYRIAYLLGYYWDWGSGKLVGGGHVRDSEWVAVDVQYIEGRWYVARAGLSAHFRAQSDYTAFYWWDELEYPGSYRGHPRIWVARNKHANYPSQTVCAESYDDCEHSSPAYWRVEYYPERNIGSREFPAPSDTGLLSGTCRYSVEKFAGNGKAECYWRDDSSYMRFNGWQESLDDVTTYDEQLHYLGF